MAEGAPSFLTGKTAGMPRWVWIGLLGVGIIAGLYIRTKRREAAAVDQATAPDAIPAGAQDTLDSAGYADPSLAGVGVSAAPPGGVIPVNSPTIPEGYAGSFADLVGLTGTLGTALAGQSAQQSGDLAAVLEAYGGLVAGGGPPSTPAQASTPAKKPVHKTSGSCGKGCVIQTSGGYIYHVYTTTTKDKKGHSKKTTKKVKVAKVGT